MPFIWNAELARFRDANGRLVPEQTIRRTLDQVIDAQAQTMREITQGLLAGTVLLADWQLQVMAMIKSLHLVSTAVAVGGWNEMGPEWAGWAGSQIKPQYRFLANFAAEIASGKQALNGVVVARISLYAQSARGTHREAVRRFARQQGMRAEKNVLGEADHCGGRDSCLGETAKGWMPIGSLLAVGSRKCKVNCRCHLIYRTEPAA